jgi:hypothetical protein
VNSLTVLPVATGLTQMNSSCAKLILTAEIECAAFMSAAKQLFGEEVALHAGSLWADVLETDSSFRCQASGLRLVTILAASRLADLMGATRQTLASPPTSVSGRRFQPLYRAQAGNPGEPI